MSAKAVIIGVFAALVIGTGVFVATREGDEPEAAQSPTTVATGTAAPAGQANTSGQYLTYREGILNEAEGQRVLFFHAPWCPQCQAIEDDIEEQGVPDGFTIIKVDYDSNQALRQKYGVRIQTTFVKVDAQGNPQGDFVAYDEPTLDSVTRNFLN